MKALDVLVLHSLQTLPDSLSKRRELLRAIQTAINPKHPCAKKVDEMLSGLSLHDRAQGLLFEDWPESASTPPHPDGQHGHGHGNGKDGKRK